MQRSRSNKQKSISEFNSVTARQILGPVDNKNTKRYISLKIINKYLMIWKTIVHKLYFGGAKLGSIRTSFMLVHRETHKLRNLKLVMNKI